MTSPASRGGGCRRGGCPPPADAPARAASPVRRQLASASSPSKDSLSRRSPRSPDPIRSSRRPPLSPPS
eukprot:1195705-Prorocentrum_minimum.AAC.2